MASPTDAGRATSQLTTAGASFTVNLPTSIASGDLLIIALRIPATITTTWPSGYQNYLNDGTNTWHDLDLDAGDDSITIIARDCDGTEGASITVTPSASAKFCAVAYRITGARAYSSQAPDILSAIGSSVNPDCPSENVTGGPKDILSLALDTHVGEQTTTVTYPTSYTNTGQITTGGGGVTTTNCQINYCSRQLTAVSSEDPSAYTISGSQSWTAITILVQQPATGDATATPATVAATSAVPAPTATGAASTSPTTVAATAAVPAATARSDNTASPATVAAIGAVPAPTAQGTASTSPSAVAAMASVPASTAAGAAVTSPGVVAATGAVPAPTATGTTGGGDATANPATVAAVGAVPAPTIRGAASTSPPTVAAIATVPALTARGAGVASPFTVAGIALVPSPTVFGGQIGVPVPYAEALDTVSVGAGQDITGEAQARDTTLIGAAS